MVHKYEYRSIHVRIEYIVLPPRWAATVLGVVDDLLLEDGNRDGVVEILVILNGVVDVLQGLLKGQRRRQQRAWVIQ